MHRSSPFVTWNNEYDSESSKPTFLRSCWHTSRAVSSVLTRRLRKDLSGIANLTMRCSSLRGAAAEASTSREPDELVFVSFGPHASEGEFLSVLLLFHIVASVPLNSFTSSCRAVGAWYFFTKGCWRSCLIVARCVGSLFRHISIKLRNGAE